MIRHEHVHDEYESGSTNMTILNVKQICEHQVCTCKNLAQLYLYTVCVALFLLLQQQHKMQQQQHMTNTNKMAAKPRLLSTTIISIVTAWRKTEYAYMGHNDFVQTVCMSCTMLNSKLHK